MINCIFTISIFIIIFSYHVSLVVTLENGKKYRVEKVQVASIEKFESRERDIVPIMVNLRSNSITLNQMFTQAEATVSTSVLYTYDAIKRNCQHFVLNLLQTIPDLEKINDPSFWGFKQDLDIFLTINNKVLKMQFWRFQLLLVNWQLLVKLLRINSKVLLKLFKTNLISLLQIQ